MLRRRPPDRIVGVTVACRPLIPSPSMAATPRDSAVTAFTPAERALPACASTPVAVSKPTPM